MISDEGTRKSRPCTEILCLHNAPQYERNSKHTQYFQLLRHASRHLLGHLGHSLLGVQCAVPHAGVDATACDAFYPFVPLLCVLVDIPLPQRGGTMSHAEFLLHRRFSSYILLRFLRFPLGGPLCLYLSALLGWRLRFRPLRTTSQCTRFPASAPLAHRICLNRWAA